MSDVVWHEHKVGRGDRERILEQKACLIWMTGLSGSGKSTIADTLQQILAQKGRLTYVLDGDNIRHGLNKDLGFSANDRKENIRRIGEVAKLFVDSGIITITAFISPYKEERKQVRDLLGEDFIEAYVKCKLEICESRDPKGMYKKARKGEINEFTGISSPYEEPDQPEIILDTSTTPAEECAERIMRYLKDKGNI